MSNGSFSAWFRRQFGKASHPRMSLAQLRARVEAADRLLWHWRLALYEREQWEARWDAAHKAWIAKEQP